MLPSLTITHSDIYSSDSFNRVYTGRQIMFFMTCGLLLWYIKIWVYMRVFVKQVQPSLEYIFFLCLIN